MPAPLSIEIRREIVNRHEAGETLQSISEELHISYNTIKKIWGHWGKYQKLTPNYEQARQKGTRCYEGVYEQALETKREHPGWGAPLIRVKLGMVYPGERLPSVRTLQRWFRQVGVSQRSKTRQSRAAIVKRGKDVHQVWAVDAKERMRLGDGSAACWIVVTDEASGAILHAEAFPPLALDEG